MSPNCSYEKITFLLYFGLGVKVQVIRNRREYYSDVVVGLTIETISDILVASKIPLIYRSNVINIQCPILRSNKF